METRSNDGAVKQRNFSRKVYLGNVLVCPLPEGRRFGANALNISQGGLELFCRDFLAQGSSVELVLRASPTRKLLGQVSCVRVDVDGNVLTIAFASPLSHEEKRSLYQDLGVKIST